MAKLGDGETLENDDFEKSSTYSMFNSSMANFNPNAEGLPKLTEDNMDEYLEALLQKGRDRNKEFLNNNEALKEMRAME
jgi:hypothetical protein